MQLMLEICSDKVLEEAYLWCCKAREDYSANSDIWSLRENWVRVKQEIVSNLKSATYNFEPMQRYRSSNGESRALWSARDAIVIKAITIVLTQKLATVIYPSCTHFKGHGGIAHAVKSLQHQIQSYDFYLRSDILSYYATISHYILIRQISKLIDEKSVIALIAQTFERCEIDNGEVIRITQGIPLGSSLSPVLAAIMLHSLDKIMAKNKVFYLRYMDDWVFLSKTRNRLKVAIRLIYRTLNGLNLNLHPDKTQMGRFSPNGFNFLGFSFKLSTKVTVATVTLSKFYLRLRELCKSIAKSNLESNLTTKLHKYIIRWCGWCNGILGSRC